MRNKDGALRSFAVWSTLAYAAALVAYGFWLDFNSSGEAQEQTMPTRWTEIAKSTVYARPEGIWNLVVEWVDGPALLKLEASDGEWFYAESDASRSGADGDLDSLLSSEDCLVPSAPVGALVGKIGGSSAGISDGDLFVAGKFSIIEVPKGAGPVYLTINDEIGGFSNNRGDILVTISSRRSAGRSSTGGSNDVAEDPAESDP